MFFELFVSPPDDPEKEERTQPFLVKHKHNDNKINNMGVPCQPAGRHPTLIKKLFPDEKY